MAHLFFSYAHADAERLYPIHALMQLRIEFHLLCSMIVFNANPSGKV